MSLKHPVFWALAGVILCALTATMVLAFWPLPSSLLSQSSSVPRSYAEAVGLLEESLGSEPGIGEGCDTQWLLHGHATGKVYVLLHGLSSCPGQFAEFAKLLHRRGDNVLMPRSPGHGLKNRMNTVVSGVTTDALIGSALRAVDLAHGLGREVVVIGFSMNGATAAWLAQNRNDLSQVVLLNPFFSAGPACLGRRAGRRASDEAAQPFSLVGCRPQGGAGGATLRLSALSDPGDRADPLPWAGGETGGKAIALPQRFGPGRDECLRSLRRSARNGSVGQGMAGFPSCCCEEL